VDGPGRPAEVEQELPLARVREGQHHRGDRRRTTPPCSPPCRSPRSPRGSRFNAPYGSPDRTSTPDRQLQHRRGGRVGRHRRAELNGRAHLQQPRPAPDLAFGAGWMSQVRHEAGRPDDDGSGNVLVTYPDGQQVRFGKNADGTYAAPSGRTATLTGQRQRRGSSRTGRHVYQFTFVEWPLAPKITDKFQAGRWISPTTPQRQARQGAGANSQTNTAGRSLTFTWTGNHVTNVKTDPVDGAALAWNYSYTGDLLTRSAARQRVARTTSTAPARTTAAPCWTREARVVLAAWARRRARRRPARSRSTSARTPARTRTSRSARPAQLAGTTDTAASFNGTRPRWICPRAR
jgi:hypothetical protein